jgi:sodium-dependent dicarboxylate transporter 2/3/5
MTPQLTALIIIVACVILFLTEWIPSALTSVLACLAFAMTGVCTFSEAFSGFSNSTVILVFGMMVIGDAMFASGVAQEIGKWVVSVVGNSERRFILIGGLTSAIMSMFLANTAVIAMFIAIMNSVAISNRNMKLKNICLATCMGSMFGGACTLVGSTPQLTVQSILEPQTGLTFSMWDFLPVGALLTVLYLIYVLVIGYPLGKKIWGTADVSDEGTLSAAGADNITASEENAVVGSRKKQIIMLAILGLMIVLFTTEIVSNAVTACICASLCVITGCTSEKRVMKNMDWPVLFRLAGCLGIGAGIDASGCGELIAGAFMSVFGSDVSPFMLLAGAVFMSIVISNFISNSTAAFIVLPPVLAICSEYGFNPMAFAMGISYGVSLCFATPLANAQTGMTMVAGYKFNDYIKYNFLLEVVVFIGIVLFVPLFWDLRI